MSELFGTWLDEHKRLQAEAYGKDHSAVPTFDEWIENVRQQALAAFIELGEAIQELDWKPWAKEPGWPSEAAKYKTLEEIVDLLHFVANILLALGFDAQDLGEAYERKMQVNRDRMARGGH